MGQCNFQAPNGDKSLLYSGLSQLLGDSQAMVAWYKLQKHNTADEEPTLADGLQKLGLGTTAQVETMNQFAQRWHLSPVDGRIQTYFATPNLVSAISKQLVNSGHLYTGIRIRYDATHGLLELMAAEQSSVAGYTPQDTINIYSADKNGFESLSSFAARPFELDGMKWHSVEQYYQYKKAMEFGDQVAMGRILATTTGYAAKQAGAKGPAERWSPKAYDILKAGMKASFEQNTEAVIRLLMTRSATLTHKAPGNITLGRWEQDFPKILMELRTELFAEFDSKLADAEDKLRQEQPVEIIGAANGRQVVSITEPPKSKGKPVPVTPEEVAKRLDELIQRAVANPTQEFHIPYTGESPDKRKWDNYSAMELAALFQSRELPENIKLDDSFRGLMQNVPNKIVSELQLEAQADRRAIAIDIDALKKAEAQIFIGIRDGEGKLTGATFTADQQIDAANSILYTIHNKLQKTGEIKASEIREEIRTSYRATLKKYMTLAAGTRIVNKEGVDKNPDITREMAQDWSANLANVMNTFDDLFEYAKERLGIYGINIYEIHHTQNDSFKGKVDESTGEGLRDWSDEVFELDPKDTASGRMKLFLASIEDTTLGILPRPKSIKLPLHKEVHAAVLAGTKTQTFRTPEQASEVKLTPGVLGQNRGLIVLKDDEGVEKEFLVVATKTMTPEDAEAFNASPNAEDKPAVAGDIRYEIRPYDPGEVGHNFKLSFIGTPLLTNLENTFERAMGLLADRGPNFGEYVKVLEEDESPAMKRLASKLKDPATKPEIRNEFVSVMTKSYQEFTMLIYGTGKDRNGIPYTDVRPINANRYSIRRTIIDSWKEFQKVSPIVQRVAGNYSFKQAMVDDLLNRFGEVKAGYAGLPTNSRSKEYGDALKAVNDKAGQLVRDMFLFNGIVLPEEAYTQLLTNTEELTKGLGENAGNLRKQFSVTEQDLPNGLFSKFLMRLKSAAEESGDETSMFGQNNPLERETTTMEILAKLSARYSTVLWSSTHRNSQGKTIWDYSLNTYLSHTIRELTASDSQLRKDLLASDLSKHNWLLEALDTNGKTRKHFTVGYLDGLRNRYGKDSGVTRGEMSDREQLLTSLALFMNGGRSYGGYLSLTHSDKSKTPVFIGITKNKVVEKGGITAKAKEHLCDIFRGEFDRMATVQQSPPGTFRHEQYEKGARFFYQLPMFNFTEMEKLVGRGLITAEQMAMFWISRGELNTKDAATPEFRKAVDIITTDFAKNLTDSMEARFRREGLVTDESHMFDRKYIQRLEGPLSLTTDREGRHKDLSARTDLTNKEYNARIARAVATDYALNSFLFNTALAQIITGDPAETYKKPKADTGDRATINSTVTEYQKRMAGIIAPGKDGSWDRNEIYRNTTLADRKVGLDYIKGVPAYAADINTTDAQELTTVREHLYVMSSYGVIKDSVYNAMIKVIDEPDKDGFYEFTEPEHRAVILQIMKPVYFGRRAGENGAVLRDYIKSSSMPLYPPFTKGLEIDKLRKYMEKSNTPRVSFISARKIGASGAVSVFTLAGIIREEALGSPEWTGATQNLTRGGFRLQQDTPYDEDKRQILTSSQLNMLITSGIQRLSDFKVGAKTMNGKELKQHKEDIRKQLIARELEMYLDSVGATQEFNVGKDGQMTESKMRIGDKTKFLNRLVRAAKDRGYNSNDIAALVNRVDGNPTIPIFLTPASDAYESMMMSLINDIVKIKVDGKSYIQASAAGIRRLSTTIPTGVVWAEGHDGKELLMVRKDENGVVHNAQVLLPFNYFKSKAEGSKANLSDFVKTVDGKMVIDPDKLPGNLREMVGARIPNKGPNSTIPMEVVGFLPDNMGDVIIVPDGITTQMGSDFDVDKLYTYRRPYRRVEGDAELKFTSEVEGEAQKLKADYFNVHWAVLKHPDMFERIISPEDKNDLKDEAGLAPDLSEGSFFDIGRQLDDFSSQKDAKRMVAYFALNLTFTAAMEGKGLLLAYTQYDDEGNPKPPTPDPIIIFKDEAGHPIPLVNFSGEGISSYKGEERTNRDNISIQLAEVVDHSKNRTVDRLNLTIATQPASAAMSLLSSKDGRAISLDYNARFLQQEAMRMFSREMAKGNDSLSEFSTNVKDKVIGSVLTDVATKAGLMNMSDAAIKALDESGEMSKSYTLDELLVLIHTPEGKKGQEYWRDQYRLFRAFLKFDAVGTRVSEMQALLNQSTKGAGPNMLSVFDKMSKFELVLQDNVIYNGRNLYDGTEQGAAYDATITTAATVYEDMLPYSRMFPTLQRINELGGEKKFVKMSIDTKRSIIKGMKSFIFSGLITNVQGERARLMYRTKEGPSLAERLMNAQTTEWGKKNYFLSRLRPHMGSVGPDYVDYIAAKATTMDDFENIRGWMMLLSSPDQEQKFLGEDLLKYTYLTGGLQDANSFAKYIPFGYVAGTYIPWQLRDAFENLENVSEAFIMQWYQHNPNQAASLSDDYAETGQASKVLLEVFQLPPNVSSKKDENPAADLLIRDPKVKGQTYPQFLSYRDKAANRWVLYLKQSEGTEIEGPKYVRIDTLGDKGMDEYNLEAGVQRSLVPLNRAIVAQTKAKMPFPFPLPLPVPILQPADDIYEESTFTEEEIMDMPDTFLPPDEEPVDEPFVVHPKWQKIGITRQLTTNQQIHEEVLPHIANNPATPQHYRELAKQLTGLQVDPYMREYTARLLLDTPGTTSENVALELVNEAQVYQVGDTEYAAGFFYPANMIKMSNDPTMLTQGTPTDIFLHEMMHSYTLPYTHLFDSEPYKNETLNELRREALAGMPEGYKAIQRSVENLEQLRLYVHKYFDTQYKGTDPREVYRVKYGLSNVNEFITLASTDKTFMKLMNDIPFENTTNSLFTKILGGIRSLFEAVAEMLGSPINKDSVLHEALVNISQITFYDRYRVFTEQENQTQEPMEKRYELRPGVFANNRQREAIDKIPAFIKRVQAVMSTGKTLPLRDRSFVLSGAAGTGKTTVLKKVLEEVDQGMSFSAPSHNAVVELKAALGSFGKGKSVHTLQSELRLKKDVMESIRKGEEVFKRETFGDMSSKAIEEEPIIIIDESSMVSDELIEYLKEAAKTDAIVIFVGDYGQLQPVGQDTDSFPFREILGVGGLEEQSVVLLENMRAAYADVAEVIGEYRSKINMFRKDPNVKLSLPLVPYSGRRNSENVTYLNRRPALIQEYIKAFRKDPENPKNALIITFRNDPRESYNAEIRKQLWGEESSKQYVNGELVIMKSSFPLPNDLSLRLDDLYGVKELFNMQKMIVKSAVPQELTIKKIKRRGNKTTMLTLKGPGHVFTLQLGPDMGNEVITIESLDREYVKGIMNKVKEKYDPIRKGYHISDPEVVKLVGSNFLHYGDFVPVYELLDSMAMDIDYGYAVTSHKSQGSTYVHTFVDEADISGVTLSSIKNRASSLYTAVSRTRDKLFIYSSLNPTQTDTTGAAGYMTAASNSLMNGSNGPWAVENAGPLKQAISQHFPKAEVTETPGSWKGEIVVAVGYAPKKQPTAQSDNIEKALTKLTDQLDALNNSYTGDLSREERADKAQKIEEVKEAIENMKSTGDEKLIPKVIAQQLKWVRSVLADEHPSDNRIMTAYKVLQTWKNAVGVFFSADGVGDTPELDPAMQAVASEVEHLNKSLTVLKMRDAFNGSTQTHALTGVHYGDVLKKGEAVALEDVDEFTAYTLSLNRAKSLLTQEVSLFMQNTARARDAKSDEFIKRMTRLEEKMIALTGRKKNDRSGLPALFKELIQTNKAGNAWGIVGRYTQDYYDHRREVRDTRDQSLENIRADQSLGAPDSAARKTRLSQVWKNYWKKMDAAVVFINTTEFFDKDTGELKAGYEAAYAQLEKDIGVEYAKVQLKEAQRRYKQFLDDRENANLDIEVKRAKGEYTPEEENQKKNEWYDRNSPDLFFGNRTGKGITPGNRRERYSLMTPRASNKQYYDANFEGIMANPKKTEIYNELKAVLQEHRKMLPMYVQNEMGANFLPVVQNHLVADLTNFKEWWKTLHKKAIDALTATQFELTSKNSERIPIRFVDKGKLTPEELSHDLIRITELFGLMAIHYQHFSRAKDVIDMGHALVKEADIERRARGVPPGETLSNTLKMIEYMRNSLMFKRPRALEGDVGAKLYSLKPWEQSKIAGEVKELLAKKYDVEQEYKLNKMSRNDYLAELKKIDDKLTEYQGQSLYLSKGGDLLIGVNQLKALGFNPFSGIANLGFGIVSMYTYANGRQDFTIKDAHHAMGVMRSAMRKWLSLGKNKESEKIMNIINKVGIETHILDSQFSESNITGRKSKIKKIFNPFELLRSTDYYMKGTIIVAMLMHSKIKVQIDGKEQEMSMWEAMNEDAHFKYEVPEGWQTEDAVHGSEWVKFRNKAIRVNQIIMGNMDRNSPKMLNVKILGRLIGQFRLSWLPEGWAARWEEEKEDIQLGRTVKGRYRTYKELGWSASILVQLRQFAGIVTKVDPFTGVRRTDGQPLSQVDMENMRRNFTGLLWTITTMAAILSLRHLFMPDDDEERGIAKEAMIITLNLMNRLNQDLRFYSSPDVANSIVRNVMPAFDVVNDYLKAAGAMNRALFTEEYGWDQAALRVTHATPYLNLINKFKYMSSTDIATQSR